MKKFLPLILLFLSIEIYSQTNQAPVVNAGPDQTINLPNSVTLNGTVTDDGLPKGNLRIKWSKTSGPAGTSFSSPNTATTTVTFSVTGTYIFKLTANDGKLVSSDFVTVTVNPSLNKAPVVNAGTDKTITLPTNSVAMNGSVTDDGLPNGTLTISWSQSSGPGTVTFANIASPTTNVTFPVQGTYVLRLTGNDGSLSTSDLVTIVVNPATTNQAPVVNAGTDKTVILPTNSVAMNGSATDDGLPNPPGTLTISWNQASGPASATFANISSPTTNVTFPAEGTYKLVLTGNDGQIVRRDTVQIILTSIQIPGSLKTVQVPGPDKVSGFDFTQFVVNKDAAIMLGKALFWEMQSGSDGVVACAACHFHAGGDVRSKNQLHPGGTTFLSGKGPNAQLALSDFPFSVNKSNDDIVGSQGVFSTTFNDVVIGNGLENGTLKPDAIFNVNGINVRAATRRNAPSVINAVYNYRNFYDGRANPVFNGVNPFGSRDPNAKVFQVVNGIISQVNIAIPLSSLASQAVGPPLNSTEMSFDGRVFRKLGKKLLNIRPLAKQLVSLSDSRLGSVSRNPSTGLLSTVSYPSLIQQAFNSKWWNSSKIFTFNGETATISDPTGSPLTTDQFKLMEVNFSLFWGLAIQLYEATLVSDDSKFDKFREGTATLTAQEQNGLNLFMGKGKCIDCHNGPEFTSASVTAKNTLGVVDRMIMRDGTAALCDIGFYNIGIRATNEDLCLGVNMSGFPLSFAQELSNGTQVDTFSFNTSKFKVPGPIQAGERVVDNGAFKVPGLRNIELTGPYFHNGGKATLKELLIAYNAGNLFRVENVTEMPTDITVLNLTSSEEDDIIAFLLTLTDERVRNESAPFDHPQFIFPNGHPGDQTSVTNDGTGKATESLSQIAAVGSAGGSPITAFLNGNPFLGKAGAEVEGNNAETVEIVPAKFTLEQNFPNPFNPSTSIRYSLSAESNVKLVIFNMIGQEVMTLVNKFQSAGNYQATFDAGSLSSGVYVYRIEAKSPGGVTFVDVKKMLLMK